MNFTVESIKDEFEANVNRFERPLVDAGMAGAIVGTLEAACGRKPQNRHRVLKMLCGVTSSKELSSPHWSALYSLVLPWKPEGGKWQSGNPNLEEICNVLLNADVDQPGQTKMFEYPEFSDLLPEGMMSNEEAAQIAFAAMNEIDDEPHGLECTCEMCIQNHPERSVLLDDYEPPF